MNKDNKSLKSPISKDDLAKLKLIIEALENDPKAFDLLEPVDYARIYNY